MYLFLENLALTSINQCIYRISYTHFLIIHTPPGRPISKLQLRLLGHRRSLFKCRTGLVYNRYDPLIFFQSNILCFFLSIWVMVKHVKSICLTLKYQNKIPHFWVTLLISFLKLCFLCLCFMFLAIWLAALFMVHE